MDLIIQASNIVSLPNLISWAIITKLRVRRIESVVRYGSLSLSTF